MNGVDYLGLPAFSGDGDVHLVVETPRGARAKARYEPRLRAFCYSRPLDAGLCYPFDWGFIPSTCAPDGDPLDGMVLHDAQTCPGTIIPARLLAILEIEQTRDGRTSRNDRLIAFPAAAPENATRLSPQLRRDLEQFFCAAIRRTGKTLRILGWKDEAAALGAIEAGQRAFERTSQ